MGPYCNYCGHRCFLLRVLADGHSTLLATCPAGMAHDRRITGQDHTTAINPILEAATVMRLNAELAAADTGDPRVVELRRLRRHLDGIGRGLAHRAEQHLRIPDVQTRRDRGFHDQGAAAVLKLMYAEVDLRIDALDTNDDGTEVQS